MSTSGPITRSPLKKRLATRVTEDDALAVFYEARRRGCTEEQMVRYIIRRFIDSCRSAGVTS